MMSISTKQPLVPSSDEPEEIPGIHPDDMWMDSYVDLPEPTQPPAAQVSHDTRAGVGNALYGEGSDEDTRARENAPLISTIERFLYLDIENRLRPEEAQKLRSKARDVRSGIFDENERKYGYALEQLELMYSGNRIDDLVYSIFYKLHILLDHIGIRDVENPYSHSRSWALWDVAKQFYLSQNQNKSTPEYHLGNPMEDPQVVQDIIDRHFGWEIHQKGLRTGYGNRIQEVLRGSPNEQDVLDLLLQTGRLRSIELTKLGRFVREALNRHAIHSQISPSSPQQPALQITSLTPPTRVTRSEPVVFPPAPPAPPETHEATISSHRVQVEFDPAGINIPPHSNIYFMSAASDWKADPRYEMMMPAGGMIPTFTGDVSAEKFKGDTLEYKFSVQPPNGPGFWIPGVGQPNLEYKALPAPAKPSGTLAPAVPDEKETRDPFQDTPEEAAARQKAKQNKQQFKNEREAKRDEDFFIDSETGERRPKPGFKWVDAGEGSLNFAVKWAPKRDSEKTHGRDESAAKTTTPKEPQPAARESTKPSGKGKWLRRTLLGIGGAAILAGGGAAVFSRSPSAPPDAAADTSGDSGRTKDGAEGDPRQETEPKDTLTVTARKFIDSGTGRITIQVNVEKGPNFTSDDRRIIRFEHNGRMYKINTESLPVGGEKVKLQVSE